MNAGWRCTIRPGARRSTSAFQIDVAIVNAHWIQLNGYIPGKRCDKAEDGGQEMSRADYEDEDTAYEGKRNMRKNLADGNYCAG